MYRNIQKSIVITILFLLFYTQYSSAQEKKDREKENQTFSLSVQILGPTMLAGHAEFRLTSKAFLIAALGVYSDYQIGATYSLVARKKRLRWYPYIGVQLASVTNQAPDPGEEDRVLSLYFPFGLRFESKTGLIISFEMAYNWIQHDLNQINTQRFMAAVRFGTYF